MHLLLQLPRGIEHAMVVGGRSRITRGYIVVYYEKEVTNYWIMFANPFVRGI